MRITTRGSGRGVAGALLTLLCSTAAFAEAPAISGYTDLQYIYSFDKPASGNNAFRSYDAQDNNFTQTTHLAITGKVSDEASYVVEVDAGSDASTTTGNGEDVVLQEGYLTYVHPSKWGFKAGKFATFEGIEVIESIANPTISRGFLYGLAEPFTHVGGVITFAPGSMFDFAAGVVNGWDQQNDVNKGKTAVAKIGMNFGDPLVLTLSGLHGPEQARVTDDVTTPLVDESDERHGANRSSVDLTGVTKIIPKTALWFQANWGEERNAMDNDGSDGSDPSVGAGFNDDLGHWSGFAIEPVVSLTDRFSIGARYEYFDDEGSRTGTFSANGGNDSVVLRNWTITPAYKLTDNLVVRAEYRMDDSNKKVFTDEDGTAQDSNSTVSAQVALSF